MDSNEARAITITEPGRTAYRKSLKVTPTISKMHATDKTAALFSL